MDVQNGRRRRPGDPPDSPDADEPAGVTDRQGSGLGHVPREPDLGPHAPDPAPARRTQPPPAPPTPGTPTAAPRPPGGPRPGLLLRIRHRPKRRRPSPRPPK